MDWLLDTNLVLRFSDTRASLHQKAGESLDTLFNRGELLHLTPQNLIEFWAVATRPSEANGLGWTCAAADTWISHLLTPYLFLEDSSQVFQEWRKLVSSLCIQGKRSTTHD